MVILRKDDWVNVSVVGGALLLIVGLLLTGGSDAVTITTNIEGVGDLVTYTELPQARDYAAGYGSQVYRMVADTDENETMLTSTYRLDGIPLRSNRYSISANNKDMGLHHTLNVYGAKDINTDNLVRSSNSSFQTDFRVGGTGYFEESITACEKHHPNDMRKVFAVGGFNVSTGIYEITPPGAGIGDDWLPCLGMLDYPDWTEYEGDGICENETMDDGLIIID